MHRAYRFLSGLTPFALFACGPSLRADAINLRSPGVFQQDYALFIDNVVGQ